MNEIEKFRELARRAKGEEAPEVDVVAGVLAEIRGRGATSMRLPWVFAAGSCAAAAGLAALAIRAFMDYYDPLSEWLAIWWMVL